MSSAEHSLLDTSRREAAAEWLLRLREDPTNAQVVGEWLKWCSEHPDNVRAFKAIEEVWMLSGDSAASSRPTAQQLQADQIEEVPALPVATRNSAGRFKWTPFVAAAAALLVAVGVWRSNLFVSDQAMEYTTAKAMEREVNLLDGSVLTLGGASTVRVSYSPSRRDVELLRGEAHFKVHHDTSRPFVVHAQHVSVTAVGTAFDVRADADRTVVNVTEGVVEIRPGAARNDRSARALQSAFKASAGQQVSVDAGDTALAVQLYEAPKINEWQEGMLGFVDEPLQSVIARVNRYSKHEVVSVDPALAELHFTGTVFRDRINDWANGLEKVFPLQVKTDSLGNITLEPKAH